MDSNATTSVNDLTAGVDVQVLGIASVDTHGIRNTGEDMGGITAAGISDD